MTLQRQLLFWLGALALFCVLLYYLGGVLTPFVAGLALAYLFDPLADRLERMGASRLVASIVTIGALALVLIGTLLLLLPAAFREIGEFATRLPEIVLRLQTLLVEEWLPGLRRVGVDPNRLRPADGALPDLAKQSAAWVLALLQSLWSGGAAIVSVLALLTVTPVVAFFLLLDWDRMVASVDSWLPRTQRDTIRALAAEIDRAVAGFLRGQALVCLILGLFYAVALTFAGLNFGFLIGLMSGLLGFIPYVGTMIGLVVSTGVAIAQFWPDWWMVGLVLGIFVFGQFVEGNFLQPKLVGEAVGLHPVWIMFALFAFGSLAGFAGLLVAVPVAAAIGVLIRHGLKIYLGSAYYHGGAAADVIPGRAALRQAQDEGPSPEPMNTGLGVSSVEPAPPADNPVIMGSGLAASPRPGMTAPPRPGMTRAAKP